MFQPPKPRRSHGNSPAKWSTRTPGGSPYRLVLKRLGAKRAIPLERELTIVEALFPQSPTIQWAPEELQPYLNFSANQLTVTLQRTPREKAPGPDYVPDEILEETGGLVFPGQWKRV